MKKLHLISLAITIVLLGLISKTQGKLITCDDSPCSYGKCVDLDLDDDDSDDVINSFQCECQPGWSGDKCDQISLEKTDPSDKGQVDCVDGDCKKEDQKDKSKIPSCLDECMNGGVCVIKKKKHFCKCPKGFEGFKCQFKIAKKHPLFSRANLDYLLSCLVGIVLFVSLLVFIGIMVTLKVIKVVKRRREKKAEDTEQFIAVV